MEDEQATSALPDGAINAVALGWNVAEFHTFPSNPSPPASRPAPLDASPSGSEYREQLVMRIRARVVKLENSLSVEVLKKSLSKEAGLFRDDASLGDLERLHSHAYRVLLAEDSRLGKSYRLGATLHHLCNRPETRSGHGYDKERVDRAASYLAELQTVLPDHAAMGVLGSLRLWEHFAKGAFTEQPPMDLAKQGLVWRSLLSGEKSAVEDIVLADHVYAAKRAVANAVKVSSRVLASAFGGIGRILVALVLLGLLGVATWGIFHWGGDQPVGSGALALVSGAGVIGFFKKLWSGVEGSWDAVKPAVVGASLDIAIAAAITQLPKHQEKIILRAVISKKVHPTGLPVRRTCRFKAFKAWLEIRMSRFKKTVMACFGIR